MHLFVLKCIDERNKPNPDMHGRMDAWWTEYGAVPNIVERLLEGFRPRGE